MHRAPLQIIHKLSTTRVGKLRTVKGIKGRLQMRPDHIRLPGAAEDRISAIHWICYKLLIQTVNALSGLNKPIDRRSHPCRRRF
jgi:hypothetical protein